MEDELVKDGIIIPDTSKEKNQEAEVVAVGPGRVTPEGVTVPTTIRVGMRVLLPKYGGAEVEIKGTKYQIVTEPEILAIIKRPDAEETTSNE
jgi:chaperonin GroES